MNDVNRPDWQNELLFREAWTQQQFISALCGVDPFEPVGSSVADDLAAARRRTEEHIEGALRAGELVALPSMVHAQLREAIAKVGLMLAIND